MIIAEVQIIGTKRKQRLCFNPSNFPRAGESIKLGSKRYKIMDVEHEFYYQKTKGSFWNERYFSQPYITVTLKEKLCK